jgi:phosphoserine phosphatase RsbU/P
VTVLRTLARQDFEPDEILRRLNDALTEQNPRGMFVTLQCLVFDIERQTVSCAGAGHFPLVLVSPGQPPRLACYSSGRPAGMLPVNPIEREILPLEPGATFVLFSDGVPEAMNAAEDFYGEDRLLAALAAAPAGIRPVDVVTRVLDDVRRFTDGARQSDDITILAARYLPLTG